MEIKKLKFKETLELQKRIYIDARTPAEFKEDHVPSAVNIPLLTEEERKRIGILYKTKGGLIARREGVDIITPKLKKLIDEMLEITDGFENVVFYCSRGGLRSYSMASFFSMVSDKNIYTVERGYKGFRNYVLSFFENLKKEIKAKFLVIDGLTGSGKTLIIKALKEKGLPVIDLEELAAHRGSAFGKIGIRVETNQKRFESLLWKELYKLKDEKLIIVEGESKKIGKINLPEGFFSLMNESPHIWVDAPKDLRIKVLYRDYLSSNPSNTEIEDAIIRIKEFTGKKSAEKMLSFLKKGDYTSLIEELINSYYDRLYHKKRLKDSEFYKKIFYSSIEEGIEKIEKIYNEICRG